MYYSTNIFGRRTSSSFIGLEGNHRTTAQRRFVFVEVMFENIDTGVMCPAYARIMAIIQLAADSRPKKQSNASSEIITEEKKEDATFFYIVWLEDADLEGNRESRDIRKKYLNCPLRRMKYMCRPNKPNTLWFDIVGLDLVTQPICGYHDVDTRPSYVDEGSSIQSMKADRFLVLPLMNSKVCTRQYKHVTSWGDLLIKEDNQAFRKVGFPTDIREEFQSYFKDFVKRLVDSEEQEGGGKKKNKKKKENQKRKNK
jgi:hypothetical protein